MRALYEADVTCVFRVNACFEMQEVLESQYRALFGTGDDMTVMTDVDGCSAEGFGDLNTRFQAEHDSGTQSPRFLAIANARIPERCVSAAHV